MRYTSFILLLWLCIACHHHTNGGELEKLRKLSGERNAIIISCNKCGCVMEAMNDAYEKDPELLKTFTVYGDPYCLGDLNKEIPVQPVTQDQLDSLSTGFHNLVIIKKDRSGYSFRLLTTGNAGDLLKFLK